MKSLMIVDEAEEAVETVAFGGPFSLTTPLGIQREVKSILKDTYNDLACRTSAVNSRKSQILQ